MPTIKMPPFLRLSLGREHAELHEQGQAVTNRRVLDNLAVDRAVYAYALPGHTLARSMIQEVRGKVSCGCGRVALGLVISRLLLPIGELANQFAERL